MTTAGANRASGPADAGAVPASGVPAAEAAGRERPRAAGWWNGRRAAVAVLVAVVVGLVAFAYRFNALGGAYGGFDNDHFVHLLRSDALRHGEQPLRDFADAELRGAWPSLGYASTAWAQQIWGDTLLVEGYLTVVGLAVAAALVFLLSLDLSRRWLLSLLAAVCVIVSGPKLYNYEKLLVLAVAVLLVRLWIARPSKVRLIALAVFTAIAALVRHDFGVYVGLAAAVAFAVRWPAPALERARRGAVYIAVAGVLLVPSVVWVQTHLGVREYVQRSLESIRGESVRTELDDWPSIDPAIGLDRANLIAVTYYALWAVPVLGALVLAAGLARGRSADTVWITTGAALVVLTWCVNAFFLRGNLNARFGDAMVPVALTAAWAASWRPPVRPIRSFVPGVAPAAAAALLLVLLGCTFATAEAALELDASGLSDSWGKVQRRYREVKTTLASLPPEAWTGRPADPSMGAARYIAECTGPDDRVLLTTYAPEVLVMARRRFAAGQGTFGLNFYESEPQQLEAVARLARQQAPIVLASYADYEGEFVHDYRHVSDYVTAHYRDAGPIPTDGAPRFRVLVDTRRQARRVDAATGLPCFR